MASDLYAEENWKRIPIASLKTPQTGGMHMVYLGYYWALDKDENAFFFRGKSPQCNKERAVVERIAVHPDVVEVRFLHVVMIKVDHRDYV